MKFQSDENEDQRIPQPKIHQENAETQNWIQKSREQEVFAAVKNPRKTEFEVESSPSKSKSRKYLPTNEKIARLQKGKNSAPEFQRVSSLQEPPKKTRMTPKYRARKYKKNDGANYKLTQQ